MRRAFFALAIVAGGSPLAAQRPVNPADTIAVTDSVARRARDLRAITVVASPTDPGRPSGVTHVSADALRRAPAGSAWDLLRQTAGLEVHEQGQGPGFASDASLRGFSSDHSSDIALWIDGVPVNEPVNGHAEGYNDWSVLFRSAVRDVDIIKGPTSALFGNFGLAGVANVRTLERFRGTELSGDAGSFGHAGASLLTGFDHEERGGGVFGLHVEREDGFRPNAGFTLAQGHARLVHELSRGVSIDLGAELHGTDWKAPGFLTESEFAARRYSVVADASDGGLKRRAQERVSLRVVRGSFIWRSTAYATEGQWQNFLSIPPAGGRFEGTGSQTEEEDRRYGLGVTSAATWAVSHAELTLGAEGRWDHARYENNFTRARTRDSLRTRLLARQASGALFVDSHLDLGDRLRLDVGSRADLMDTRSTADAGAARSGATGVYSPKAGVLFRMTPAWGAYANASRGFRSTDGVVSDPALPVITAWAYEGGLRYDRDDVVASAALFRMNVSNEQTFDPVARGSVSGGSSRRQGLELQWSVPVATAMHASGECTFNDARYTRRNIVPDEEGKPPVLVDGLRVYNSAEYVGAAALDIAPAKAAWRVRIAGSWVGPYSPLDEPREVVGGYGLMHLTFSVRWNGAEAGIGVRNALDRAYPELVAGRRVAPGQPRALSVSVRKSFGAPVGR